jgi:hypothetical protein
MHPSFQLPDCPCSSKGDAASAGDATGDIKVKPHENVGLCGEISSEISSEISPETCKSTQRSAVDRSFFLKNAIGDQIRWAQCIQTVGFD